MRVGGLSVGVGVGVVDMHQHYPIDLHLLVERVAFTYIELVQCGGQFSRALKGVSLGLPRGLGHPRDGVDSVTHFLHDIVAVGPGCS